MYCIQLTKEEIVKTLQEVTSFAKLKITAEIQLVSHPTKKKYVMLQLITC